ncbi:MULTISPECIES: penicillin-binding protein 1A [unclassified Fibrobacter]|uniref:penicillin-binding protein 1A n=1 Tax=unclassified Fibrobacter TaxID=2634177 RepID=UPI000B51FD4F|nr:MULTISPECIES: PBP1A family penicillin-binding protein [Fibrobacter]MCL4101042.1 Penicillin-binding protein 1A [Fibrobacter succinogenes]MCQ2099239.1 PBP1A family penicillin-binding protein [Fibrobacter sp.]OWV16154.1 penicillin-binding protein [Fibrobacter sp. UWH1]
MNKVKAVLMNVLQILKGWFTDKKVLIWLGILALPVIIAFVTVVAVYNHFAPELPSLSQLEQINPKLVTKINDMNGEIAHEYFVERREWTPFDSIPEDAIHAVMATEDRAFYDHWGMNVWAIPSAILESATSGKKLRGASTLTQQLTKLLFLTPERTISRKIKEMMTAIRIEQTYTKKEILEFYMNEVYLSGGNYGFQAAGKFYFGRPLDSLTIPEYAVLAGMLQRPEAYRPDRHPKASLERRNTVLYAMRDAGYINNDDYHKYIETPITLAKKEVNNDAGLYFYEEIRKYMEKKYGENSLYADGVTINSTIDPAIQAYADSVARVQVEKVRRRVKYRTTRRLLLTKKYDMPEDSVVAHFDSIYADFKKNYLAADTAADLTKRRYPDSIRYHHAEVAAILIENETGAIRAMVGGSDWNASRWNRAVQSLRQPGSSFKPIVYSTAMDNGASPCDSVNDQPVSIPDPDDKNPNKVWRPANFEHDFEGMMTLRRALYRSKNLPAILTGMKYGLNNVVNYARKFGIVRAPLMAVPSLALGSVGATLMEMTSAYTVFPNGGNRIEPYMIESIVDRNGEVIERNSKVEHEVLRPASAYLMVDILKDVNIRGTAARVYANGFTHPSGGKTGTTNDYTDCWYIGFTKQYTMGVWVGSDNPGSLGAGHTGTEDALPVWIAVMKELHKDLPRKPFPVPSGVVSKGVCNHTGKAAGEFCSEKTVCLYTAGYAPTETCDGNHFEVKTKSADDATLFSNKGAASSPATSAGGAKKARKMF